MAYNSELTWDDLVKQAGLYCRNTIQALEIGLREYNEWQSFRAGRNNATIAVDLGKPEADIANMDAAFSTFKELHDFANNVASPSQGDRLFSMRLFS